MIAVTLTETSLDACAHLSRVADPSCGAGALFSGIVRNHHHGRQVDYLIYEAYQPMAEQLLTDIATQAVARFGLHHVAISHRLGTLQIGDIAVVVAASSVHREAGFLALPWIMDCIKRDVPIFKHEFYRDGSSEWVVCQHTPARDSTSPHAQPHT